MIQTASASFMSAIGENNRQTKAYIEFYDLYNNTTSTIDSDNIISIEYSHGLIDEYFEVGQTPSAYCKLKLKNVNSAIEIKGGTFILYFGVETSPSTFEYVNMGAFNVTEFHKTLDVLTIDAFDNMIYLNTPYAQYSTSMQTIIDDIMTQLGVSATLPAWTNSYTIPIVQGRTYREALSDIATILGCYAYIDRSGQLKLKPISKAYDTINVSGNGTTVTLTFSEQTVAPFTVGSTITVKNILPSQYNGTFTVTACTTKTVSFSSTATGAVTKNGTILKSDVLEIFNGQYDKFNLEKTYDIDSVYLERDSLDTNGEYLSYYFESEVAPTSLISNGTTATAVFDVTTEIRFPVGSKIILAGFDGIINFDGTYTVTACTTTSVTFTCNLIGTADVLGVIGQYGLVQDFTTVYGKTQYLPLDKTISEYTYKNLKGVKFSTFDLQWIGNPVQEVGDLFILYQYNSDGTFTERYLNVGHIRYVYNGSLMCKISNKGITKNPNSENYDQNRQLVDLEISKLKTNLANVTSLTVGGNRNFNLNTSDTFMKVISSNGTNLLSVYDDKFVYSNNVFVGRSNIWDFSTANTTGVGLTSTYLFASRSGNPSAYFKRFGTFGDITRYYFGTSYIGFLGTNDGSGFSIASVNDLQLQTNGVVRATILSSGNIGFGITSPVYDVHSVGLTWRIEKTDTTNTLGWFVIRNTSTSAGVGLLNLSKMVTTVDTTGYFLTCTNGNGSTQMRVMGNGNLQNLNNSYGAISDAKMKENIVDASPKLNKLMKVKVRNYNLIGDNLEQIGVVAQELEEVFPSLVDNNIDFDESGNEIGITKSVKYSVFVPILIKAIQELTERVNMLESK